MAEAKPLVCLYCKSLLPCAAVVEGFLGLGNLFGDEETRLVSDKAVCSTACEEKYQRSCRKEMKCGHHCTSTTNHMSCPTTCIHPGCASGACQTLEDSCVICLDGLFSAPTVHLDCGHVFHHDCIQEKMKTGWSASGPISLSYAQCPLCNAAISWNGHGDLSTSIRRAQVLRTDLMLKGKAAIETESIEVAASERDKYILQHLNFYECFTCKHTYYGGKRECAAMMDLELDPKSLLCGGCRGCKTHGADYMVYKCRFCCSVAEWFCFGHTHFCEQCHNEAGNYADYENNYRHAKKECKVCPGKDKCPLGVVHAPNGEEHLLWCSACNPESSVSKIESSSWAPRGGAAHRFAPARRGGRVRRARPPRAPRVAQAEDVVDVFRLFDPEFAAAEDEANAQLRMLDALVEVQEDDLWLANIFVDVAEPEDAGWILNIEEFFDNAPVGEDAPEMWNLGFLFEDAAAVANEDADGEEAGAWDNLGALMVETEDALPAARVEEDVVPAARMEEDVVPAARMEENALHEVHYTKTINSFSGHLLIKYLESFVSNNWRVLTTAAAVTVLNSVCSSL